MISYTVIKPYTATKKYVEGKCKSTDSKPLDVANGSTLLEIDTGTLYMFDESSNQWRAWS